MPSEGQPDLASYIAFARAEHATVEGGDPVPGVSGERAVVFVANGRGEVVEFLSVLRGGKGHLTQVGPTRRAASGGPDA